MGEVGFIEDLTYLCVGLLIFSFVQLELDGVEKRHENMSGIQYALNWLFNSVFG